MGMNGKKLLAALLALAMVLSMGVSAFAAEEPEAAEEQLAVIGEASEDGYQAKLVNSCSANITKIGIKVSGTTEFFVMDMAEGDVFEKGEASLLCHVPDEDADEETRYDFEIVFSDGTVGPLYNVDLADIQEGEIKRNSINNVPYLIYTSKETGEEVNSNDAQQDVMWQLINTNTWPYWGGGSSMSSSSKSSSSSSRSGGSSGGSSSSSSSNSNGCINGGLFY